MSDTQTNKSSSLVKTALKIALVFGLFYLLIKKGFISIEATGQAMTRWEYMIPAFTGIFASALLGVVRWQWLLQAQGVRLPWSRVLQLVFVGNFFNIALPGAVSGDLIKAYYVAKEIQSRKGHAFGSILFDRVAGLSALVVLSASALGLGYETLWGTPLFQAIQFFVGIAALVVVVLFAYLFLISEERDPLLGIFKRIEGRYPAAGSLTRIYEGLRHYHNHKRTVIAVLALSLLIHLMVGYINLCFARALGVHDVSLLALYAVVPLGLLVTAVPVAPAGVGTGHAAFLFLFRLLGTDRGADIFSLYALANLTVGAVGGLVYLRFRAKEPAPVLA